MSQRRTISFLGSDKEYLMRELDRLDELAEDFTYLCTTKRLRIREAEAPPQATPNSPPKGFETGPEALVIPGGDVTQSAPTVIVREIQYDSIYHPDIKAQFYYLITRIQSACPALRRRVLDLKRQVYRELVYSPQREGMEEAGPAEPEEKKGRLEAVKQIFSRAKEAIVGERAEYEGEYQIQAQSIIDLYYYGEKGIRFQGEARARSLETDLMKAVTETIPALVSDTRKFVINHLNEIDKILVAMKV